MYIKLYGKIYAETPVEELTPEQLKDYATETKEGGKTKVIKYKGKFYILCNIAGMRRDYLEMALNDIIVQTDRELDEERAKNNRGNNDLFKQLQKEVIQPVITPGKPWDINRDDMFKWDPNRNPVWCNSDCTTTCLNGGLSTLTCSNNQETMVVDMSNHELSEPICVPSCWVMDEVLLQSAPNKACLAEQRCLKEMYTTNKRNTNELLRDTL